MKESVRTLEQEISTNLSKEDVVNSIYKNEIDIDSILAEIPEMNVNDMSGPLSESKRSVDDLKKEFFGEKEKYVTEKIEGKFAKQAKKAMTYLFGGQEEKYVPSKKGKLEIHLDKINNGCEKLELVKNNIPAIKEAHKEGERYVLDLKKTYLQSRIQAKQFFEEEATVNDLIEKTNTELERDDLEVEEYDRLMNSQAKLEEKRIAIDDYLDILSFQVEGSKNVLEYMEEQNAVMKDMVRNLDKNTTMIKQKLGLEKFLIGQAARYGKIHEVYEKLFAIDKEMGSAINDITSMLESSNKIYLDNRHRISHNVFTQPQIGNVRQMRKEIYQRSDSEREQSRKRLKNLIYSNTNETQTQEQQKA